VPKIVCGLWMTVESGGVQGFRTYGDGGDWQEDEGGKGNGVHWATFLQDDVAVFLGDEVEALDRETALISISSPSRE
jgi:hypothetical protein